MKIKIDKKLEKELIAGSVKAQKKAYAPYSKLHVGATLITTKGNVYSGCNVENCSFGLTSCAERNAIFAAISAEGAGMKIAAIAVTANSPLPISPCGACRQVIAEFSDKGKDGTRIFFRAEKGMIGLTVHEILPGFFEMKK
jgi:cytidine deaminase